jgi:hypothetical protein
MRILLFLFFAINLFAHPLNITKMELNLDDDTFFMRYAIFNIYKAFHKEEFNKTKVNNYVLKHIKINNCKITLDKIKVRNEVVVDSYYKLKCTGVNKIKFNLFFDFDRTQQGVMKIVQNKKEKVFVFSPSKESYILNKKQNQFLLFLREGIIHILEGIDHIFFLTMLIVSVLLKHLKLKVSLVEIVKVATAFTLSHSMTLSLSMLNILTPPEQLVEVLIASTILFVALNNFYRWIEKEWQMAFVFGFIHGFGFANALREMNVSLDNFIQVVFGFNSGVEIGQLFIISVLTPLLFALKSDKIMKLISVFTIVLSILWIIDRMFNLHFMPF